jgi:D-alanine-D-alanine ligase
MKNFNGGRSRKKACGTVVVLLDELSLVPGSVSFLRKGGDWSVAQCLKRLGYRVCPVEYTDVATFLQAMDTIQPDVVFNLTDVANGDRAKDAHVCALCELIGMPYTGTGPRGLVLGRDKAISKLIAERAGFKIPRFVVFGAHSLRLPSDLPFPMVVKPRFGDASEGITGNSLVSSHHQLIDRIKYMRRLGYNRLICEEYIAGREFIVGVLHDQMVRPKEFIVDRKSRGAPRLATQSFKYDVTYRKKWGIHTEYPVLSDAQYAHLKRLIKRASNALETRDYARFDIKLTAKDEWVFLEANPNPGLSPPGIRNWAGAWDSVKYDLMIKSIIERALERASAATANM